MTRRTTALVLALVAAAMTVSVAVSTSVTQPASPPDVIYHNAKIVTVDDAFSYAQAVAITGDRFTAVGTNETVHNLAGPATRQIDLKGLTVTPGLREHQC